MLGLDWIQASSDLVQLAVAFLLALPIAWERERHTRIMGLRTFPLVAVASCGYVLVAVSVVGDSPGAQSRIIQGLMTGIGFIGGGAILKEGDYVRGTATATSIWLTGALGAAVGFGRYEIAVAVGIIDFAVLFFLTPIKEEIGKSDEPEDHEAV